MVTLDIKFPFRLIISGSYISE